jgi:hypothetical protein
VSKRRYHIKDSGVIFMEEKQNSPEEFSLKALLKPSCKERAKLKSILFRDHSIPYPRCTFTIDERSEEADKKRLDEGTKDDWEYLLKLNF